MYGVGCRPWRSAGLQQWMLSAIRPSHSNRALAAADECQSCPVKPKDRGIASRSQSGRFQEPGCVLTSSSRRLSPYGPTVTSAALLAAPPIVIRSGESPAGKSGTLRFTCNSPTKPGASPADAISISEELIASNGAYSGAPLSRAFGLWGGGASVLEGWTKERNQIDVQP
jgi:hypothetical protein